MKQTLVTLVLVMLLSITGAFADVFVHVNTNASRAQDLTCIAEQMSDPDLYSFTWFRNDELFVFDGNVVPAASLTRGEVWTCQVRVESGMSTVLIGQDAATIVNAPPQIISTPVTTGSTTASYNYDVNAIDADGDALTYSLPSAPAGMTIVSNTGLIVWNPTANGVYPVTVSVTDGFATVTQSFTIVVGTGCAINVNAAATPNSGNSPLAVSFTAIGSGCTAPYNYAWDFTNDASIDTLAQNPSFTYNTAGTYTARVVVTDSAGVPNSATQLLTINVNAVGALTAVATATPNNGVAPLSVTFGSNVNGGTLPYTYRWDFTNDGSYDSTAISPVFTFSTAGTYTARLNVTDNAGATAQSLVTVTVAPVGSVGPTFTTSSCPDGKVDKSYSCNVNANNAVNYTLTNAPSGMTINVNSGVVSWKPTSTGTYSFTVRATASNGLYADKTFTIKVTDDNSNANSDDLIVNSIVFDADEVQQGHQAIAHVNIENQGNDDFNDLTVTMSIDELGLTVSSDKFDLNDGDKETQELIMDLPNQVTEGSYLVRFVVANSDVKVVKYMELYIKGTKTANSVSTPAHVVVQPTLTSYQPPVKERANWFAISFMIILFILLLALAIYMTKKAMNDKNTNEATVSFEHEVM